ncbi:MAG: nuclear transport factor 2 family protein, partial [Acidobacteria bacterium]|nr:nuclear transport factor 2 family protein [Acidobacteriota bacterium]
MPKPRKMPVACLAGFAVLAVLDGPAQTEKPTAATPETVEWFRTTEQALMDAIAVSDKTAWDRVMDPSCVVTSEEGQLIPKAKFLDELRPLPKGLAGSITVKDLTVQELPGFAVVRYLADERETVFGQKLAVQYRITNTYRRDGKDWKMVASHLSVVTQDPPTLAVSGTEWPSYAGTYRLLPDGWTFTVELREGQLYGGRDSKKLMPLLPLTS